MSVEAGSGDGGRSGKVVVAMAVLRLVLGRVLPLLAKAPPQAPVPAQLALATVRCAAHEPSSRFARPRPRPALRLRRRVLAPSPAQQQLVQAPAQRLVGEVAAATVAVSPPSAAEAALLRL